MKHRAILAGLFALTSIAGLAQTTAEQTQLQTEKAADTAIRIFNAAENILQQNYGTAPQPISAQDAAQVKQTLGSAARGIAQVGESLQAGDLKTAAGALDKLQADLGLNGIPPAGAYLRRGSDVYAAWQAQTGTTVENASPAQLGSLAAQVLAAYTEPQNRSAVRQTAAGLMQFLAGFQLMEQAPSPYELEARALSQEAARLKRLAESQGVTTADTGTAGNLLNALKQRAGEQLIGEQNPRADQEIQAAFAGLFDRPRPLFSAQEARAISRLLQQLGAPYAQTFAAWQQNQQFLMYNDNPQQNRQSLTQAIENANLPAKTKQEMLDALNRAQ